MKRVKFIIKNFFIFLFLFLLTLSINSTEWTLRTFNIKGFDEIMFQLTTPIKNASSDILDSFLTDSLLPSLLIAAVIFFFVFLFLHYLSCKNLEFNIQIFKKKFNYKIKGITLKKLFAFICFIASVVIVLLCLKKIMFLHYVYDQTHPSSFIEDYYVEPRDVKITFPKKKKNLIYIYLESMESTYFSEELGGIGDDNHIEALTDITRDNISFSDTNKFGGAYMVGGTEWTSGAMVAHSAGLPLKTSVDNIAGISSMLDDAYTLGDILHDNGYNQMIMFGSDKDFGNRGLYYETHGDFEVYDYYKAIEEKKIPKDYYVWWGFEDSILFDIAKEEITELASKDEPFNFTMLTVDTHTVDGFVEESCPIKYSEQYFNAVNCSAMQVSEFVKWIKQQDFYSNTTVILVGDHVSMQDELYPDDVERRIYNVYLNSSVKNGRFKNRTFNSMDFFPTTLASLGVEIEGDRLALGTNLFSDRDTLMEEVGKDYFMTEIKRYSPYYNDRFIYS